MKFHKTLYVVGWLILVSGLTLVTNAQPLCANIH